MATKYYAMIDGEQKGPFELEELPSAGVRPSTYIWCKGMDDWEKAEDNADVCRLFRNHLYDLMHPAPQAPEPSSDPYKIQQDPAPSKPRTNFDRYLEEGESIPTIEEIESQKDTRMPPVSMVGYAWLVTLFCCWPTGIVALIYAYKSKNMWKNGQDVLSHDYNRLAKLWTGISLFMGIFIYGILIALA